MLISNLYERKCISKSAYNVCRKNSFEFITELRQYYLIYKSFLGLDHCTESDNQELIELCIRFAGEEYAIIPNQRTRKNMFYIAMPKLGDVKKTAINNYIQFNIRQLPPRSKNALKKYLNDDLTVDNFAKEIYQKTEFAVKNINHIGQKSIPDLELFLLFLKNYILEIGAKTELAEIQKINDQNALINYFANKDLPEELFNTKSVFQKINILLKKHVLFNKNLTTTLTRAMHIYNDNPYKNFKEVAEDIELTLERIRQVAEEFSNNILDNLAFLEFMREDFSKIYGLDLSQDYLHINDEIAETINKKSGTNFSKYFITLVLYYYLQRTHNLIGDITYVLKVTTRQANRRYSWTNLHLVKKDISRRLDFYKLMKDIEKRIQKRISKTYDIALDAYLSSYMKKEVSNDNMRLKDVVRKLVKIEFGSKIAVTEYIHFIRNTFRQIHEYAYEALDILGKPSKISEIHQKILELHPDYDIHQNSVRASMKRKNGFLPMGRSSTFALQKWESNRNDFRGGTIRDIAIEFLQKKSTPQKLRDVATYVLKFRTSSNLGSISQNLKLDRTGRFVIYEKSRIGLSNKTYPEEFKVYNPANRSAIKSWQESYDLVMDIISKHNRLPSSRKRLVEEVKLYRWLNVQKNRFHKNKLKKHQHELIQEIIDRFPSLQEKVDFST